MPEAAQGEDIITDSLTSPEEMPEAKATGPIDASTRPKKKVPSDVFGAAPFVNNTIVPLVDKDFKAVDDLTCEVVDLAECFILVIFRSTLRSNYLRHSGTTPQGRGRGTVRGHAPHYSTNSQQP